jgi:hypothetical protein
MCRKNSAIERAALVAAIEPAADALAIAGIDGTVRRGCAKRPKDGTPAGVRAGSDPSAVAAGKFLCMPAPPQRRYALEAAR